MTAWGKLLEPKLALKLAPTQKHYLKAHHTERRKLSHINCKYQTEQICILQASTKNTVCIEKSPQPFFLFTKAPGGTIRWRALTYNNTQKAQLLLPSPTDSSLPLHPVSGELHNTAWLECQSPW